MRAYWFDNLPGDQRHPHDSGREVDERYLSNLGILHFNYPDLASVNTLAQERGYKNRDEITISPEKMGDVYEEKVKMFFNEHLHEDEEIRYILDGGGYFDVRSKNDDWVRIQLEKHDLRSKNDDWVRIQLEKHDLMIMPAGIYHRFTTDGKNYTKAMRLFKDEPKWTPLNRGPETEGNTYRKEYVEMRERVATAA